MPTRDNVIIGAPCWIDLMTTSRERAAAFYGGLFGWTVSNGGEEFGFYGTFASDGAGIAGVMEKTPDMEGMPDIWTVYFGTGDTRASVEKAIAAGGQSLMEPVEVGTFGTMGMLSDPTGASVGLWQPNTHRGFEKVAEAGAPVWFELLTRDLPAAGSFYETVFDASLNEEDTGEGGPPYRTINIDGEPQAGLFDATGLMPDDVPPYWTIYFGVPDIDEAVRYVEEQGGRVITPVADSPYGKWSTVADPMGAVFVVMQV